MGPSNFASLIERQVVDHWACAQPDTWRKGRVLYLAGERDCLEQSGPGKLSSPGIGESDSIGIFWLSPSRNGLNCQALQLRAGREAGGEVRRGSQSKTV